MLEPKLEPIVLHIDRLRFTQEGDCRDGEIQHLDVSIESGGGGHFIRLRTDGWAVSSDDLRRLASLLDRYVWAADKAWGEEESTESKENNDGEPDQQAADGGRVPLRKSATESDTSGF